jgi:hypothetical protein
LNDFPGAFAFARGFLDSFQDFGVVDQPINQNLSFGQLKGFNLNIKSRVDFIDDTIDPTPNKPA